MEEIILFAVAVIPPILFLKYIIYMDRYEPEPFKVIAKAFLLGAFSAIPAGIVEEGLMENVFYQFNYDLIGAFVLSFVVIGPVEEFLKLAVVILFIWNNKDFNEENDGIVYVGACSLGFALLENIFYVFNWGFTTGLVRRITAIPLHTLTGIVMGYYVGIAKFSDNEKNKYKIILKGLLLAILIHGGYDTFALQPDLSFLVVPMIIILSLIGYNYLKKGRDLSLKRWKESTEDLSEESKIILDKLSRNNDFNLRYSNIELSKISLKSQSWKIVVSRILFSFIAIFWLLLIIGMTTPESEYYTYGEIILGGLILTAVPVFIAIFLEISYRKVKKLYLKINK